MGIDWAKLKEPFPASDIEWRIGMCGKKKDGAMWAKALAYVTNRAIMDRLDLVFTPGGWQNDFKDGPKGGLLCCISAKIDGEWVSKWDGADNTVTEAIKGGLSGSMKRAAVQWGPGRYLYNLTETFVKVVSNKGNNTKFQNRNDKKGYPAFHWEIPQLPPWALPATAQAKHSQQQPARQTTIQNVWAEGAREKFIIMCEENKLDQESQLKLVGFYLGEIDLAYMTIEASNDLLEMFSDVLSNFISVTNG